MIQQYSELFNLSTADATNEILRAYLQFIASKLSLMEAIKQIIWEGVF